MNARSIMLISLLFLLIAVPFTAAAQLELPIDPAYTLDVPRSWTLDDPEGVGFYVMGDVYAVYVLDPVEFADTIPVREGAALETVLIQAYSWAFDGLPPRAQNVEALEVEGRTGVIWQYNIPADDVTGLFIVLQMSDGTYGLLDIYAYSDSYDDPQSELADLIASFDTAAAKAEGDKGETCFVFTDQARTVALRVGPGENRTSVAFLPVDTEVEVTGVFVTDGGEEWFQLDKTQAAPQSAAAEIWMRRGDADERGGCDSVGETFAPPVVPIAVQPPTAVPGAVEQPPAVGSITPTPGRWQVNFNPVTNASCLGGSNVPIPSIEVYETVSFTTIIANVSGGITLDGDFAARISGTNSFEGSITFEDSVNVQIRVTFTSANSAAGSATTNFIIDGTPCSGTVTFTFSR